MKISKLTTITAALSATLLLNAPHLTAQDATPTPAPSASAAPSGSPSGDNNNRGNRRGFGNMADFRARMNDRLKEQLKVTDEEWAVIQPLLEKVQNLEFANRAGGMGGFRRGGGNGGNGDQPSPGASPSTNNNRPNGGPTPSPEASALRTALETDGTSNDDIKAKLQAFRDSRKKTSADLAQAREDLKKVLTLRQEAVLGILGHS